MPESVDLLLHRFFWGGHLLLQHTAVRLIQAQRQDTLTHIKPLPAKGKNQKGHKTQRNKMQVFPTHVRYLGGPCHSDEAYHQDPRLDCTLDLESGTDVLAFYYLNPTVCTLLDVQLDVGFRLRWRSFPTVPLLTPRRKRRRQVRQLAAASCCCCSAENCSAC